MKWRSALMEKNNSVDVVIITALQKEQQAVIKHLDKVEKVEIKNRVFYRAEVLHENGQGSYSVVLLSLPGMGNVQASIAATQAITIWNPSQIILTGISGGIKADANQYLGDIVVGEQIVDYELGKIKETGMEHRYEVMRSSFPLINAARNLQPEKWVLSSKVPRPDGTTGRVIPKVHFGVVASGQKIVANSAFLEEIRAHWSKIAAIEMEGFGIALAAFQAETAPKMFMVKGICDWADNTKNDEWQDYAADIAAAFVISLLKTAPFESKVDRPQAIRKDTGRHSGKSKIKLCKRLGDEWRDLADYFDIPLYHRRRFTQGRECQDIWEWLELRNKLDGLKDALIEIERKDLVEDLELV